MNAVRQTFASAEDFATVTRVPLAGRGITVTLGQRRRGGPRELVAIEGPRAELAEAFELFEEWHDRAPDAVEIGDVPEDTPPVLVRLGDVRGVLYRSDKWGGRPHDYIHETEEPYPGLYATPDGARVIILGGGLVATGAGLEG